MHVGKKRVKSQRVPSLLGKVYKAVNKVSGQVVALKRVRIETEKEGFPITGVREIKILTALRHQNVVRLLEIISEEQDNSCFVHLVFEYMDHDLTGIFNSQQKFEQKHIKCLMLQLFQGLAYLHEKGIIHRDMKGSNLLLNNDGILKLADFGLARYMAVPKIEYTNRVITLWYRPPELLLGSTSYNTEIDMWSSGCIMAEMYLRKPLFPGNDEISQLEQIWKTCGTPNPEVFPEITKLPWWGFMRPAKNYPNILLEMMRRHMVGSALTLIESLLEIDPSLRPSARVALNHQYFVEEPLPCEPFELPKVEGDWHEYESKLRKKGKHPDQLKEANKGNESMTSLVDEGSQKVSEPKDASCESLASSSELPPEPLNAVSGAHNTGSANGPSSYSRIGSLDELESMGGSSSTLFGESRVRTESGIINDNARRNDIEPVPLPPPPPIPALRASSPQRELRMQKGYSDTGKYPNARYERRRLQNSRSRSRSPGRRAYDASARKVRRQGSRSPVRRFDSGSSGRRRSPLNSNARNEPGHSPVGKRHDQSSDSSSSPSSNSSSDSGSSSTSQSSKSSASPEQFSRRQPERPAQGTFSSEHTRRPYQSRNAGNPSYPRRNRSFSRSRSRSRNRSWSRERDSRQSLPPPPPVPFKGNARDSRQYSPPRHGNDRTGSRGGGEFAGIRNFRDRSPNRSPPRNVYQQQHGGNDKYKRNSRGKQYYSRD